MVQDYPERLEQRADDARRSEAERLRDRLRFARGSHDHAQAARLLREIRSLGFEATPGKTPRLVELPTWRRKPSPRPFTDASPCDRIGGGSNEAAPNDSPKSPGPFEDLCGGIRAANPGDLRDPLLKPKPEQVTRAEF